MNKGFFTSQYRLLLKIGRWHQTIVGFLVFAVIEIVLAYTFASIAVNDGNLLLYVVTVILLVGTVRNIVRLLGKVFNGYKATKA